MFTRYICGLDIGSSKVAAALAVLTRGTISGLFFEVAESRGVSKGCVVDSVELVEVVSRVLKGLKAKSGVSVKSLHANISGQNIVTKHSRSIIPLAERGNKMITALDIEKVVQQAFILGSTIEEEVLHQIPVSFCVDHKANIANPAGLFGHKLEVDLYLICARLAAVQTIAYAINQAGCDVEEISVSGLATCEAVFDDGFRSGNNILCDIGADFTELVFVRDGALRSLHILPMGGADLARAITEGLSVSEDLTRQILSSYGTVDDHPALDQDQDQQMLVRSDTGFQPVSRKQVAGILNAKTASLCLFLKDVIEKEISLSEVRRFVLCGRTALQEGFIEMVESRMGIPVEFARILESRIASLTAHHPGLSGRKYLTFATALGMVCKELTGYTPKTVVKPKLSHNPLVRTVHKLKEVYQEYF